MAEFDLTLASLLLVVFFACLIIIVLRSARHGEFWYRSPRPSIQPTWIRSPGVRSGLKIPDAKLAFLDIETEGSGKVCLIAVCEDGSAAKQFVANGPGQEKEMLEDFVHYAWAKRDFVFCYYAGMNRFDEAVLRARLRACTLPYEFLVMKDLFYAVRASLVLQRHGLKYVVIPSLCKRSVRSHDDQLMTKLREYNMDDARALSYVVDWFKKNHSDKIKKEPVKWRTAKRISPDTYEVPSFRGGGIYKVNIVENRCSCPVSKECKHLQLVRELSRPELLIS